jgi:hypothetical protein
MVTLKIEIVRPSVDVSWFPIPKEEIDSYLELYKDIESISVSSEDLLTLTRYLTGSQETITEFNNKFDDPSSSLYARHAYNFDNNITMTRTIEEASPA